MLLLESCRIHIDQNVRGKPKRNIFFVNVILTDTLFPFIKYK